MRVLPFGLLVAAACAKPNTNMPMWRHYDRVRDAHEAIVSGQLQEAQRAGQWLANRRERDTPRGAETLVAEMRQHGRKLSAANDLEEAALHTAAIAEICGECHQTHGPGPAFSGEGLPSSAVGTVRSEMRRHTWAVARLWEGLIGPSDRAWLSGANVLRDAPMTPTMLPNRAGAQEEIRSLERRVHELGVLAQSATASDRTVIYSNLLATCTNCHAIVRTN